MQIAKLSPISLASNGLDLPHDGWKVEAGIYSSIIQELSATGQPIWEARVRSALENHCAQISLNMFWLIFSLIVLYLLRMGIPASSFSCAVKSPSCKQRSKLPSWVGGYAICYIKLPTTNLGDVQHSRTTCSSTPGRLIILNNLSSARTTRVFISYIALVLPLNPSHTCLFQLWNLACILSWSHSWPFQAFFCCSFPLISQHVPPIWHGQYSIKHLRIIVRSLDLSTMAENQEYYQGPAKYLWWDCHE